MAGISKDRVTDMRRPSIIVVPLVVLIAVAVWWMNDRQSPAPIPPPAPIAAPDLGATASTQGAARPIRPGENDAAGPDRSARAAEPPIKAQASEAAQTVAAIAPGDAVAARSAQIRWDGPTITRAGVPFTVALRMTSDEQVGVVRMELQFDPKLLEVVSVRAGDLLSSANFGYRVLPNGSIRVGATNQTPTAAADAAMILVTLKPVTNAGTAELRISLLAPEGPAGSILYDNVMPFTTTVTP